MNLKLKTHFLVVALVLFNCNLINASDSCAEDDVECHEKAKYKKGNLIQP